MILSCLETLFANAIGFVLERAAFFSSSALSNSRTVVSPFGKDWVPFLFCFGLLGEGVTLPPPSVVKLMKVSLPVFGMTSTSQTGVLAVALMLPPMKVQG